MSLTGAIIGGIAGVLGFLLSTLLFAEPKKRNVAAFIFMGIFFYVGNELLLPYYNAYIFESNLHKKFPLYESIAKFYPNETAQFITAIKQNIIKKGGVQNEILLSSKLVNFSLHQSLPSASNQSVYNLLKVTVDLQKKMMTSNPIAVLAMEFPIRVINNYSLSSIVDSLDDEDVKHISLAKKEVIESAARNSNLIQISQSDIYRADQSIKDIMQQIINIYGDQLVSDTFSNKDTPFSDPRKSAEVMIAIYEYILSKGEEEASLIFKVLFLKSKE